MSGFPSSFNIVVNGEAVTVDRLSTNTTLLQWLRSTGSRSRGRTAGSPGVRSWPPRRTGPHPAPIRPRPRSRRPRRPRRLRTENFRRRVAEYSDGALLRRRLRRPLLFVFHAKEESKRAAEMSGGDVEK